MTEAVRPTKKQRELLDYIENFIEEHGYSPSYREIMNGLNYNSVATVALHVGSLIKRGHLRKREHSARSLEVVRQASDGIAGTGIHEQWLVKRVESHLQQSAADSEDSQIPAGGRLEADSQLLINALRLLGLSEEAGSVEKKMLESYGISLSAEKAV